MIELSKHIEILLLDNDCVIVPELGGFIAHYQPARYEEDEGVYLPPIRTVGFNPELTMNDGLLTQSYMQAHHTDFPDAARKIAYKVEEMKDILFKDGFIEIPGIGILNYTLYNTYEFHPNESGILSPSLYALDIVPIRPLSAIVEEWPMEEKEEPHVLPMKEKKVFQLNPKWLGNAVAVAIAAVLFFILSAPVENTYVDKGMYASLGTDCLFDAIRPHSMATTLVATPAEEQPQKNNIIRPVAIRVEKVTVPATEVKEKKTVKVIPSSRKETKHDSKEIKDTSKKNAKVTSIETKRVQKTPEKTPEVRNKKKYHIIVASMTTSADAERILKEYKKQGHSNASIVSGNGRFRIALRSFSDKSDAYQNLNVLKKSDAFKEAWMLTSK